MSLHCSARIPGHSNKFSAGPEEQVVLWESWLKVTSAKSVVARTVNSCKCRSICVWARKWERESVCMFVCEWCDCVYLFRSRRLFVIECGKCERKTRFFASRPVTPFGSSHFNCCKPWVFIVPFLSCSEKARKKERQRERPGEKIKVTEMGDELLLLVTGSVCSLASSAVTAVTGCVRMSLVFVFYSLTERGGNKELTQKVPSVIEH